jgi:alkylation response protein AidB-like acyl-CoA dehydrogenase
VRAVCGPVAEHPTATEPELAGLGVFGLRVPAEHGGTDLGLAAALVVCEEAGAALTDGTLLDTMTAVDALGPDPALLKGDRAAALVWPDRPVTDPGPDGLLLVVDEGRIAVLPAGRRAVRRSTALGEVTVFPDCSGATTVCEGEAARAVLAADLLRRAAALAGVGMACLVRTVRRARTRRQFGRALIDNQAVAFRLARLAVHAQAVRALIASLADEPSWDGAAGAFAEAAEFASHATAEAVQSHGAFGMVADSPVARHYRFVPLAVARGRFPAAEGRSDD